MKVIWDEQKPITMFYTNYKGITSARNVSPINIYFASTKYHPEPQWIITAYDHDKKETRDFAVCDCDFTNQISKPDADTTKPISTDWTPKKPKG